MGEGNRRVRKRPQNGSGGWESKPPNRPKSSLRRGATSDKATCSGPTAASSIMQRIDCDAFALQARPADRYRPPTECRTSVCPLAHAGTPHNILTAQVVDGLIRVIFPCESYWLRRYLSFSDGRASFLGSQYSFA